MANTDTNTRSYWYRAVLNTELQYSTQIDDCDDTNASRYPGNAEICDGLDNDCNEETADGKDVFVKLVDYNYIPAEESDEDKFILGDACVVYQGSTHSVCSEHGKIACQGIASEEDETYRMICKADIDSGIKDDQCDGIDDDCDGLVDEDYVFTPCVVADKQGICAMGAKVCDGGKEVCRQLYQPREYDFYGDDVDSNCDGVDWDTVHAVFVDKYHIEGDFGVFHPHGNGLF